NHATISWATDDDLTPKEQLVSKLQIFHVVDPTGAMEDDELVSERTLGAGETAAPIDVEGGKQYRVVVVVRDQAGNESSSAIFFQTTPDAMSGGCGCSAV